MSQEKLLLERWRGLSSEKQQELLNIAGQFVSDTRETPIGPLTKQPKRNLKGLWASQPTNISYEDIQELRREMHSQNPSF